MYGFTLTDEQQAFVEAIRDLARRECGTREQRDALTNHNTEPHNPEMYKRVAELAGWGSRSRRSSAAPAAAWSTCACSWRRSPAGRCRSAASRSARSARSVRALRDRGAEAGDPHRHRRAGAVEAIAMSEPEAGSDVGNLRCKAERRNGGYVINGQKTWISEAQHAEHILLVCRTESRLGQAQGADDAVGPRRLRRGRDPRHRDDGRQGRQRRLLQRLRGPRRQPVGSKAKPGCS